jgi:4-amino-4-deoxychorismate lyase
VVALLTSDGGRLVPAETPILRADDLGVLRGDGIFETMHVRGGEPWLLDEHLARMRRSAERLALALPPAGTLRELALLACSGWSSDVSPDTEATLRLVCTRGAEGGDGTPTVYATVAPVSESVRRGRHDGVRVATATLAVPVHGRAAAPWLLSGAKTLSYAVNMASLRWAAEQGVDDVLWISSDGYVLEAPTATVVWLDDDTLCTVPAEPTGILAGTTARALLDVAGELGWGTAERLVRPAELPGMGGVWLASSVRGVAEVRAIDGVPLPRSGETGRMRKLLGFA